MIRLLCDQVRPMLGALADGELSGADMLRATGHIEQCSACAHEFASLRRVGDLLRDAAAATPLPALSGLADGVVTRVRAEAEESWLGIYHRAVDSWHWAIVGAGSVAGTAMVTLVAAAVLLFGTPPERSDSLAGVYGPRPANDIEFVVVDVLNGRRLPTEAGYYVPTFVGASDRDMVGWLADTFSGPGGTDLSRMADEDRRFVEAISDTIGYRRIYTRHMKLMTSTTVSASSP